MSSYKWRAEADAKNCNKYSHFIEEALNNIKEKKLVFHCLFQ